MYIYIYYVYLTAQLTLKRKTIISVQLTMLIPRMYDWTYAENPISGPNKNLQNLPKTATVTRKIHECRPWKGTISKANFHLNKNHHSSVGYADIP